MNSRISLTVVLSFVCSFLQAADPPNETGNVVSMTPSVISAVNPQLASRATDYYNLMADGSWARTITYFDPALNKLPNRKALLVNWVASIAPPGQHIIRWFVNSIDQDRLSREDGVFLIKVGLTQKSSIDLNSPASSVIYTDRWTQKLIEGKPLWVVSPEWFCVQKVTDAPNTDRFPPMDMNGNSLSYDKLFSP